MSSKKADIREQFGLDYLIKGKSEKEQRPVYRNKEEIFSGQETEKALDAVGGDIIEILSNEADKSARLHDLVESTGVELETLFRVIDRLENLKLVKYAERNKLGNHKVQLTEIGKNAV